MKKFAPPLLALFLLVGCTTTGGEVDDAAPSGTNRPVESETPAEETSAQEAPTSEEPAEEEPTSEAPLAPTNPVFGDTFSYEDGLSVTVGAPTPFEPGQYSAGAVEGQPNVMFVVTVVNGTATNFEPATIYVTVQSGNTEGSQIFESDAQIMGSPSTTLLPGREAVFNLGFSVADPNDIVMEFAAGFSRDAIIFTT